MMEKNPTKTQTQAPPRQAATPMNQQQTPPPVAMITPSMALNTIKEKFPEEAAILAAVCKNNIVSLGTDEAFTLRDNAGEIRAYKQRLHLSQREGTLIQPVPGGPFALSAQGYEVWQEKAGACVIFPSEVLVDGKWQQNPSVVRDEKNRRILAIYARAVAFRFSDKGIPMVSDWTTIFDTPSYRLIDLLAKAKNLPQAFRLLPAEMKPEITEEGGRQATWAVYPFDESTNLWVNTAHNEALQWFSQILNREKKAIDFAQTFAKRNSLKHLSGLQKAPGPEWDIPVLCWRPKGGNIIKWDATQYVQLQERVGKMISGDRREFAEMALQAGTERTSEDEAADVVMQETDPEDQALDAAREIPNGKPLEGHGGVNGGKPSTVKLTTEEEKLYANLTVAIKEFPREFATACKQLGIKVLSPEQYAVETARDMFAVINSLVDAQS